MQLLNDEGIVVATTRTGRDGRYRFTSFSETGDYTVRIVPPARLTSAVTDRAVLVLRGDLNIGNVNFGLRSLGRSKLTADTTSVADQTAAMMDAAITEMQLHNFHTISTVRPSRFRGGRITSRRG